MIPPGERRLDQLLVLLDGMVLSGGGDIDPASYGGQDHEALYNVSPERDETELAIISKIVSTRMPLMFICRGMQMLNVALGGTIIPHLPDVVGEKVSHRAPPRSPIPHSVQIHSDSRLAEIMQADSVETASWHHQAIEKLAQPLRVVAHAPDGTIEAVELPDHPWLVAVQWHPEVTAADDPTQQRLFDSLVEFATNEK